MPEPSPARTPTVRVGKPSDIHAVMDIARIAANEGALLGYDEATALRDIYAALSLDHGIMGVIDGGEGKLEGVVLLRIGPMWCSTQQYLEERSIFVHPDYRSAKGGRASKLIEFTKTVSRKLGMPLWVGILSNSRTEAKVRAYRRHFGEPAGAFWLYNPKAEEEAAGGEAVTHAPDLPLPAPDE